MERVSIIIPVYNLEDCIKDTIESVIGQSYENLEIILIDDGSKDSSPLICDNYAERDLRIRVLHKENGGVSSARNAGLDIASGDYIMFVDGDDLLEPDAVLTMLENINANNSDMCICSRYYINSSKVTTAAIDAYKEDVILKEDIVKGHLCFKITASLWLCMIKRKKVGNIRFNETIHALEDWKYLFDVFINAAERVSICRKPVYHYTMRDGSASHSAISERKLSCFNMVKDVLSQTAEKYPDYISLAKSVEGRLLLHILVIAANCETVDEKYNNIFKKLARKNLKQILSDKEIHKRQKAYLLMLAISPKIYYFAYKSKYKVKGIANNEK